MEFSNIGLMDYDSCIGEISGKIYSGCYDGEINNIGDNIIVKIKCAIYHPSLSKKQIIFLVDESGSMCETMPSVKASLFAARNAIIRLIDNTAPQSDYDNIFTNECNVSLITFSDTAKCRWESIAALKSQKLQEKSESISFTESVNNLISKSSTNMGDALLMAFNKTLIDHATWIIVLTDGVSNKGSYQTVEAFKNLMKKLPQNTKIIPLGYTSSFDPEILSELGTMTYLGNEESIAETLGSIMGEIATSFGMNAKIKLPKLQCQQIDPDSLIIVPDTIGVSCDIIGSNYVGCLFNERKYIYGYLPWGNTTNPSIKKYHNSKGYIKYYDINSQRKISIPFIIENGSSSIPDDVYESYFESSKAKLILNIYKNMQNRTFDKKYINSVKSKLEDWKHPLAIPHKEEILRIINIKSFSKENYCSALGVSSSTQNQTNYTNTGRYTTNTQRLASSSACEDFRIYNTPLTSSITNVSTNNIKINTSYMNELHV